MKVTNRKKKKNCVCLVIHCSSNYNGRFEKSSTNPNRLFFFGIYGYALRIELSGKLCVCVSKSIFNIFHLISFDVKMLIFNYAHHHWCRSSKWSTYTRFKCKEKKKAATTTLFTPIGELITQTEINKKKWNSWKYLWHRHSIQEIFKFLRSTIMFGIAIQSTKRKWCWRIFYHYPYRKCLVTLMR